MSQTPKTETRTIRMISLDEIVNGPADTQRVSRDPDVIANLAHSISRLGVMTPLILRVKGHQYETVAGGYRREAARASGLTHVPAEIIDCDDNRAWEVSTVENMQRHNLSVVEEAEMIRVAHVELGQELQAIAQAHGRTIAWCEDRLDMLRWDPLLLEAVHHGRISKAAAAPLAKVDNPKTRHALLDESVRYGATARMTAQWVATATLVSQNPTEDDISRITNAPSATPPRLLATCWMCLEELAIASVSHMPTCAICLEAIARGREARTHTLQADKPATASSHSSAVTPA